VNWYKKPANLHNYDRIDVATINYNKILHRINRVFVLLRLNN